jgi:hypothetical protein
MNWRSFSFSYIVPATIYGLLLLLFACSASKPQQQTTVQPEKTPVLTQTRVGHLNSYLFEH